MRIPRTLLVFAIVAASVTFAGAAWQAQQQAEVQYYGSSRLFSNAVRVGNTIYLSGKIGRGEGIEAQTRAAMESVKSGLEEVGANMDDVVKCLVMLAGMEHYNGMNTVYTEYFPKHRPARSAFAASGLAANALVEVECIAVLGARNAD
jgi:enamine deaminase RidA (YjgF/YER057c/UK114 family)